MTTENASAESDERSEQSQSGSPDTADDVDGDSGSQSGPARSNIVAYLEWGAIAGLGLVALLAVFQFYFSTSRAIGIWISRDFEPLFQAAFNLVILLLAATGIAFFARRLR